MKFESRCESQGLLDSKKVEQDVVLHYVCTT